MVVMEGGERAWYGGNTGLSSSSPHTGTSGSGSWYGGNTGLSPFSPHTGTVYQDQDPGMGATPAFSPHLTQVNQDQDPPPRFSGSGS